MRSLVALALLVPLGVHAATRTCESHGDCGGGEICVTWPALPTPYSACAPLCDRDSECATGTCQLYEGLSACLKDDGSAGTYRRAAQLARTPPASWMRGGWQDFHWGMGEGDVLAVLKKSFARVSFDVVDGKSSGPVVGRRSGVTISVADLPLSPFFFFLNGRLARILLTQRDTAGGGRAFRTLLETVSDKYGKPTKLAPEDEFATWSTPDAILSVTNRSILYERPGAASEFDRYEERERTEKRKRDAGKL